MATIAIENVAGVVNYTRKHFNLKWQTCKICFCYRKCTVVAADNLSVHKLRSIGNWEIFAKPEFLCLGTYWRPFVLMLVAFKKHHVDM